MKLIYYTPVIITLLLLKKDNGEKLLFKGARDTYKEGGIVSKIIQHYQNFRFGTIDFSECIASIIESNYDVIYLRFYLPGRDTISFLKKIKKACPHIIILLEYPTSNIENLFKLNIVSRVGHFMNQKKITAIKSTSDYFITLTKDKTLYGNQPFLWLTELS